MLPMGQDRKQTGKSCVETGQRDWQKTIETCRTQVTIITTGQWAPNSFSLNKLEYPWLNCVNDAAGSFL